MQPMNSQNNKLVINVYLMIKELNFNTRPCVVEKSVAVCSGEFQYFKMHLLRDNVIITANVDLMYYDPTDNTDHCLLIYVKDGGDGLLIESEGSRYAIYAQYIPNVKLLYEDHVQNHL